MQESAASSFKLPTLVIGGLVSLIVGVGTGYLVNWLGEKRQLLTYDITSVQAFPGQKERVGIVSVRIANKGQKELEDIQGGVQFSDAEVRELTFQGLPPSSINSQKSATGTEFRVPFLNPGENFSVQALVRPKGDALQTPSVNIRAKGVVGTLDTETGKKSDRPKYIELLSLAAATMGALVAAMSILFRRLRMIMESSLENHHGDQRDIFAYILGVSDLHAESENILHWSREWSYWSISDYLTEMWITNHSNDKELLKRGASSFAKLLQYASINEQSVRLIELNAARLYLSAQEPTLAKERIRNAVLKKDLVVMKRIEIDPELKKAYSSLQAA